MPRRTGHFPGGVRESGGGGEADDSGDRGGGLFAVGSAGAEDSEVFQEAAGGDFHLEIRKLLLSPGSLIKTVFHQNG